MKKFFIAFTLLVAGASSAFAQWGRPVDYAAGPGLKDAYKDYFTIGVAVNRTNVSDPAQIEIIKKQFNSVTAENATSVVRTASRCVATASAGTHSLPTGCSPTKRASP